MLFFNFRLFGDVFLIINSQLVYFWQQFYKIDKMMKFNGTLIPIGGNEDKGSGKSEIYTQDFIQEGILSHVVKESGGLDAKIAVITTASSVPVEVGENYLDAFGKLGCKNVSILDIRTKEDAESEENVRFISEADCVMFSGGDQSKITDIIGSSSLYKVLHRRLIHDPIVIAGTSAGAMVMSKEMIAGGQSSEALFKGGVRMYTGLKFLPTLLIDSHFIQRGRFGRLAEACARFPHLLGLGLAEDTAIVIKNCNDCKVIGSGMVVLFDPSDLTHNNVEILDDGTPMSLSNMKMHILSNGDRFFIDKRKLEILPLDAAFE